MHDTFFDKFSTAYNSCFPLRRARKWSNSSKKPWISRSLLESIKCKKRLYKQFIRNPTLLNEIKYKKYKNKLTHSLRLAKRSYYENKLTLAKSNTKKTWRILNELMNHKTNKSNLLSTLKLDSHNINNPNDIANQFCEYFANIDPRRSAVPKKIQSQVTRPFLIFGGIFLLLCFLNQPLFK